MELTQNSIRCYVSVWIPNDEEIKKYVRGENKLKKMNEAEK